MILSKSYAKKRKLNVFFNFRVNFYDKKLESPIFSVVEADPDDFIIDNRKVFGTQLSVNPKIGEIQLLPIKADLNNPKDLKRHVGYNVGAADSGKTYAAIKMALAYREIYPNNKIFLVSTVNDNEDFKTLDNTIVINIRDPLLIYDNWFNPLTKFKVLNNPGAADEDLDSDFKDSLVIFDDLEGIEKTQKDLFNAVTNLQNGLLDIGRHVRASVIMCKHEACDYAKTKHILKESNFITCFPCKSTPGSLLYLLQKHLRYANKEVNYIINSKSRVVILNAKFPYAIIENHKLSIPKSKSNLKE